MVKNTKEDNIIPTQFIKKNFDLNEKIDVDFLESIEEIFDANVSVISLALLIDDKEDETKKEIISFNYRNDKEQKNKEIMVDLINPNSFNKIKRVL